MRAGLTNDVREIVNVKTNILNDNFSKRQSHTIVFNPAYATVAPEWEHIFYAIKVPKPSYRFLRTASPAYLTP